MGVGKSVCPMTLVVMLVSPALVTGQRAALLTVAGGAVFVAPAMLGGGTCYSQCASDPESLSLPR